MWVHVSRKARGPSLSLSHSFIYPPLNLLWDPELRQTQPLQNTLYSVGDRHKYNQVPGGVGQRVITQEREQGGGMKKVSLPGGEAEGRRRIFEYAEAGEEGPEGEGMARIKPIKPWRQM